MKKNQTTKEKNNEKNNQEETIEAYYLFLKDSAPEHDYKTPNKKSSI
jgi:hypothetical protein